MTAVGIGGGFVLMANLTDRLSSDYDPNQVTAVAQRKLDGKEYTVISQTRWLDTRFVETKEGTKRLDELEDARLAEIEGDYQADVKRVEAKYKEMEKKAAALK